MKNHSNLSNHSLCTLSTALAMMLYPGATMSQSHCRGLEQSKCSPNKACRWVEAKQAGEPTKAGKPRKLAQRAHCRIDLKAAAAIAAKQGE
jgi:hypothetical protein